MIIKFFAPLDRITSKEAKTDLKHPITLRVILNILRDTYQGLAQYISEEKNTNLSASVSSVLNSKPIKLDDIVRDINNLNVLLPATGG